MSWLLFISGFHFCGVRGSMSSTFSLAIVYHSLSLALALPQLPSTVHAVYVYLSHDLTFNYKDSPPPHSYTQQFSFTPLPIYTGCTQRRLDTRHQTSPRRHMHQHAMYWTYGSWLFVSIAQSFNSRRMPLEKNSVSLKKLAFQPCSTPAKQVSSEAFSLLMINQTSAFQANQGFIGLFSLSGFDIGLRKFMTKPAIETSALM